MTTHSVRRLRAALVGAALLIAGAGCTSAIDGAGAIAAAPAAPLAVAPPPQSPQAWWSDPANVSGSSTLTSTDPTDDSTLVTIPPTVPISTAGTSTPLDASAGDVWQGQGLPSATTGQLIGYSADGSEWCTATVVHSPKHNLLVTAGHCVWKLDGTAHSAGGAPAQPSTRVEFVPGASGADVDSVYPNGNVTINAPYGIWQVDGVYANASWTEDAYFTPPNPGFTVGLAGAGITDDVSFVTVAPRNGQNIEDVTGAQGLLFSDSSDDYYSKRPFPTVQLGYPIDEPFDGRSMRFCSSATVRFVDVADYPQVPEALHDCPMTPGSSGGPWLTYYDSVSGGGYVYAVTSLLYLADATHAASTSAATLSLARDYPLYQQLTS